MKTTYVFYLLLYATLTEETTINIEGFERGEVSFQCSHKLAWKNNKYLCKDPCKNRADILVTVESGRRAESGRITLVDSGNGVFTVTFSQLRLSDSRTYWCAVDRPGLDTYTAVHLTVKEAVANETTTAVPDVSSTWAVSNSTQLTTEIDTKRPTNLSTISNFTNRPEENVSTGIILYATVGGVAMLTILILATSCRKRREISKPQPPVCSNSTDISNAHEREVDCEYDDIDKIVQCVKKVPESTSVSTHRPRQGPPASASAAAECSATLHIYENISAFKGTAGSRYSPADDQNDNDTASGTYIKPLPPLISERTGERSLRKHTNKPTTCKNAKSCTGNSSLCVSRSCCESTGVRPRSLWFGLDLSGISKI